VEERRGGRACCLAAVPGQLARVNTSASTNGGASYIGPMLCKPACYMDSLWCLEDISPSRKVYMVFIG
jgi:hypothetical protein